MNTSRKSILISLLFLVLANFSQAQVGVGTILPNASAQLDVSSTSKGFLPPRMTSVQRNAISSPAEGLMVYDLTLQKIIFFNGSNWEVMSSSSSDASITIGTQQWATTNLSVATYSDGTVIPEIIDQETWSSLTTAAWCWYDNNSDNGAIFGRLYNWYAANGIYDAASSADPTLRKNICPTGWHIPTDAEWTTLSDALGGDDIAGGKMKSRSVIWTSPNTESTNSSGFSALPTGFRASDGSFDSINKITAFWIPENSNLEVVIRGLFNAIGGNEFLGLSRDVATAAEKPLGFSVRCIND